MQKAVTPTTVVTMVENPNNQSEKICVNYQYPPEN